MTRRPAATLMEVLVSIFIMGIGLLAILALFPLGALRMAQAIQDDRAGHLALNGLAVAQTFNLRSDPLVTSAFKTPVGGGVLPFHPDRPGYPVYVDPIGVANGMGNVGNAPISRITPQALTGQTAATYWFTLTDDLRFGQDGTAPVPNNALERENTLSYALMFRQPRSSVANVVEVSVVVYARRPLTTAIGGGEASYPASFNTPSTNMITLNSSGLAKPALRAGSWILDATYKTTPAANPTNGWAHAYFYRVVSVNEVSPDQFEIEVATPLRRWSNAAGPITAPPGTIIVMDNVVEVLERGTGW